MEARLKAIELVEKFEHKTNSLIKDELAKDCAKIAVDEILNNYKGGEVIYQLLKMKKYSCYNDNEYLIPFDLVIGIFMLYTENNMCIIFHNNELDSLPNFSDEIVEDIFKELFEEDK